MVVLGIEQFVVAPPRWLQGKKLGLLCNQASTDRHFRHSRDLLLKSFPGQLTCLFSPQHGFFSEKQDNMIESDHAVDPVSGLPLFSLYGEVRKPTQTMLDHLDVLLVDLFDVGTRVYTFLYTLANSLEAAAECGKKIVVLDRPNPVGGERIEGNLLREDCRSFVGMYPIPMRHGLTLGEFARYINTEHAIGADLEIIPMAGWQRFMDFRDTGLPFVFPSPNMPTPETAMVYPGQVIWEGTNISEGRGTSLPFEVFGAPFLDQDKILEHLGSVTLPGCHLRPIIFEPTSNKWAGRPCKGFQLHVTNQRSFMPYRTTLALLQAVILSHPDDFAFKEPPYEYEFKRLPMDLILGDKSVRDNIEQGKNVMDIEHGWQAELNTFAAVRKKYYLYD